MDEASMPLSGGKKGRKERGPMIDLLPEFTRYQDYGCEVSPSCLGCPLPHCKYDEPDGGRLLLKALRNQEIRRLHREAGLAVGELARRFRLSKRSVHRILASERTGEQGTRNTDVRFQPHKGPNK